MYFTNNSRWVFIFLFAGEKNREREKRNNFKYIAHTQTQFQFFNCGLLFPANCDDQLSFGKKLTELIKASKLFSSFVLTKGKRSKTTEIWNNDVKWTRLLSTHFVVTMVNPLPKKEPWTVSDMLTVTRQNRNLLILRNVMLLLISLQNSTVIFGRFYFIWLLSFLFSLLKVWLL